MFGTNACIRLLPFDAEIRGVHRQRHRQIALERCLPVLRVADAQLRIDGKRIERVGDAEHLADQQPVGKRQRVLGVIADAERRRQRRLLRELRGDRLIHVGVAIDAVSRADDERRSRHRPPGDAEPRLEAALVRRTSDSGYVAPVTAPVASDAEDRRDGGEVRGDVEIHEPPEALGDRRLILPAHAEHQRERRAQAPVVGDIRPHRSCCGRTCRRCRRRSTPSAAGRAGSRRNPTLSRAP